MKTLVLYWFCFFLFTSKTYAFVNMVRHGYTTCITCHYNSSGGGSLNSYGKYIAQETLGTFNNSQNALPWITPPRDYSTKDETDHDKFTKNYSIAFLARGSLVEVETKQIKRRQINYMQSDIELVGYHNNIITLLTAGPRLDSATEGEQNQSDIFIRRFYAGYQTNSLSIKTGKFFPEFGLNLPNHNVVTRKDLFFNHNQEPNVLQASHFTRTFDYSLAFLSGNDKTLLEDHEGFSSTISYKVSSMRYGLSILHTTHSPAENTALSLFGTVGYLKDYYVIFEFVDKKKTNILGKDTKTQLGYIENGVEIKKGVIPYINWEFSNRELANDNIFIHSPGIGIQFTPYTHFEIMGQFSKQYSEFGDATSMFAMLNIYF